MNHAFEGGYEKPEGRILLIASRFNSAVVEPLLKGAFEVLKRQGVSEQDMDIVWVPGAFELPITCQRFLRARPYVGAVAFGAVIRGETAHFDYVAGGCNQGLLQVSLQENIPITFGILTCETTEQAVARAGMTAGNKGAEAALALLETLSVVRKVDA